MNLNKVIPFAAVTFVIAGMASMGTARLQRLRRRADDPHRRLARLSAARHLSSASASSSASSTSGVPCKRPSSPSRTEATRPPEHPLPPISFPERLGAVILIAASVVVGIYPQVLLNIIVPALNSPLFEGLRKGSWQ